MPRLGEPVDPLADGFHNRANISPVKFILEGLPPIFACKHKYHLMLASPKFRRVGSPRTRRKCCEHHTWRGVAQAISEMERMNEPPQRTRLGVCSLAAGMQNGNPG
jgi:hypothetical protein